MSDPNPTKLSIIIPVLNEATNILRTISAAQTGTNIEIIVVDGGSTDGTLELVKTLSVQVVQTTPNRALQMNTGATLATGDILLFLHADTRLPSHFDPWVRQTLANPGTIAGAFQLKIDAKTPSLRLIEKGVNWRSRSLQMPYGDQAIFLKTTTFQDIGGFPPLPIMEDFELMRQLRRQGHIEIVPTSVVTSGRRWQKLGVLKTTLLNQLVILGYLLKISPQQLASWYRQHPKTARDCQKSELF